MGADAVERHIIELQLQAEQAIQQLQKFKSDFAALEGVGSRLANTIKSIESNLAGVGRQATETAQAFAKLERAQQQLALAPKPATAAVTSIRPSLDPMMTEAEMRYLQRRETSAFGQSAISQRRIRNAEETMIRRQFDDLRQFAAEGNWVQAQFPRFGVRSDTAQLSFDDLTRGRVGRNDFIEREAEIARLYREKAISEKARNEALDALNRERDLSRGWGYTPRGDKRYEQPSGYPGGIIPTDPLEGFRQFPYAPYDELADVNARRRVAIREAMGFSEKPRGYGVMDQPYSPFDTGGAAEIRRRRAAEERASAQSERRTKPITPYTQTQIDDYISRYRDAQQIVEDSTNKANKAISLFDAGGAAEIRRRRAAEERASAQSERRTKPITPYTQTQIDDYISRYRDAQQIVEDSTNKANKAIKAQGDDFGSTTMSMLRHVVVYWMLYEAVHAAARAMGELGKNMLMIDAAAARASYAMGIGQRQARGLAMDALITGARYGQGPTEAIGAFLQASRYTKDAATQQTLIESSARLAALTGGDQADAMGDLITLSRQWNLEQSQIPRVLDLTAAALKNTNVDLGDFIDSMAQGSVVGKMMGWTLEQTAGMYAGYLQVSGKTPSQATTIFERIATIGSRPTDLAKLNQLGIATQKINGEMLDASVIIGQLSDKWAGLSKAQQDIAIEAFGGQRLAAEFRSLIDNYPTLVQFQKDFNVKIGEGKDATDKLFNNLEAQAARVLPSVGAAVTAALTPSPEVYAGLTRFFRELSNGAEGAARRNVEPAVRALRDYQKENEQYGSVWKLAGTTQQRQAEQLKKQAERYPEAADFINSPGFKYYADEYAKADDAQKKVIEDLIVEGMKKRRAETLALANQKGTRGADLPSGYTRPVPGAITQNPEEYERLAKFNIATSRMVRAPNVIETDLTKAQGLAVQQAAEERAKQVTEQLIRQQEIMEGVKFTESERAALAATLRKQYEDQVIYLQVSKNEWLAITGLAAQYAGELAKAKELRPSISVMPEMNRQNFEKYKRYVSQYERVLDQMGVKQTPYQALIFGQGGQVFKTLTTQEANTLAMALLTEEIKKNTETQGQLRGHWNIPSAFGYKPPTVWEYYSKTGSTEMGPVNYPWMHEGADKKGKPLIGSVATGITDTYATTFGNSVNKFDAAVMAFSNVVKPGTFGKASARAGVGPTDYQDTDDWYLRHRGFVPTAPGVLPHTNRFDRMNDLPTIADNEMMGMSGLAPGAPAGKAALVAMADRFSAQYGLKDKNVLRAIIQAESQWNPNAVGDAGASIGLLQNHMRGGRGTGYTKAQLLDPEFNVRLGMAEISKWYRQGEALGLSGPDLARYVGKHAQRPAAGMEEGYAKAYGKVGSLSGGGPLPVQGMPQLQSATQQVAPSVNALRAADQAGFARMAMAQTLTNTLLTSVVMHLVRIAANTAKPIIVQGGSASGGGRSAVQQSGMAGQGNQGTNGNAGRYLA